MTRKLLQPGNFKLGPAIFTWSIPAGETCPGATPICAAHCYACKGFFIMPSVKRTLTANYQLSLSPAFIPSMQAELQRLWPRVVRIHVAGDFYDAAYVAKWITIIRTNPTVRFYAYTRSWRVQDSAMQAALKELARLPNMRLWYSADRDSALPSKLPRRVRIAWMQTEPNDLPTRSAILFRVHKLRRTIQKRVPLPLQPTPAVTCPVENGATGHRTDCQRCKLCWN